jgi:hypothetical protein
MIFPFILLGLAVTGVYVYRKRQRERSGVVASDGQQQTPTQPAIRRVVFPIVRAGNETRFLPSTAYEVTDDKKSAFLPAKQLPVDIVFSVSGEIEPPAQIYAPEGNDHVGGVTTVDRDITIRVGAYAKPIDSEGNYADDAYSAMIVANAAGHNNEMRVFVEPASQQ